MEDIKPLVGENLDARILEIMAENPKGISNDDLQNAISSPLLIDSLQKLLNKRKIEMLVKGNSFLYVLKDSKSSKKFQSSDVEENVLYAAVERAGNNGVTNKDLKFQCKLPIPQINKILKVLEGKKLIKCVTSTSKKKLFMLYDMEPSHSITGGTFYSGQEFETELVDALANQCYKYLLQAKSAAEKLFDPVAQRHASFKSSKDICDFIASLNICRVNLSVQDIEAVLESLIYDGKVEKSVSVHNTGRSQENQNRYRILKPLLVSSGLMRMPCGVCPVFQDCHVGGEISPSNCVYMKEWLDY